MENFLSSRPFMNEYFILENTTCPEFTNKVEEARKLYWDACKYPRKKKKKIRKEATTDYALYMYLSKLVIFEF